MQAMSQGLDPEDKRQTEFVLHAWIADEAVCWMQALDDSRLKITSKQLQANLPTT